MTSTRRVWPHPAVLATAVACFVAWMLLAFRYFTFANDDIYVFTVARQQGLSRHLLALNLFSHFAPFNRLLHWVALNLSPLDVRVGFGIGALLVAGMLAAYLWLLSELRISWPRQCVAVLVVTVSITLVGVGTWWGEIIHIPTSLGAVFLVLAAHVRGIRLHSWRWQVAAVVFLLLGFTTQERTLYAPAIAVALDVFVVWGALPLRSALLNLWREKWPLLAMFAISAAAGAFVIERYFTPEPRPHLRDVVMLFPVSFFKYFVPAVLGFNPGGVPMPWPVAVLLSALLLALLLAATWRNLKPLAFLAVVYLLYYGLLAVGRLGIYPVDQEAGDLQYAAYVVPFLMVALVAARWPRLPRMLPRPRRLAAVAGVAALAGCLLSTTIYWEHTTGGMQSRRSAHVFLDSLRASQAQWSSKAVSVLPLRVPTAVAATWIDPYGREETFLQLLQPDIVPGDVRAGTRMVVIDEHARVHDAVLQPLLSMDATQIAATAQRTPQMSSTGPACYHADSAGAGLVLPLGLRVAASPLLLRVDYQAVGDTSMTFGVADQGRVALDASGRAFGSGHNVVVVNLDGTAADVLSIDNLLSGTSICLRSLALERPLVRDAPADCRAINRHGVLGASTPCPEDTSGTALGAGSQPRRRLS